MPAPPKECRSLKNYAESKLTKAGKSYEKSITSQLKHEGIARDFVIPYREADFEQIDSYEESWEILTFKNISMEEAFLIGRLCGGQSRETYRNIPYIRNKQKVTIQGNSQISEDLVIEKKENGEVVLTSYIGI